MTKSGRDNNDGIPTIALPAIDESIDLIRQIQSFILKHPVASKAAYCALIEEGKSFATTPDGVKLAAKLERSELLHRARLLLDLPGLSALETSSDAALPSSYIDTVFMMASNSDNNEFLKALFSWEESDDSE